jgi:flagellar hook-length control protein FliK
VLAKLVASNMNKNAHPNTEGENYTEPDSSDNVSETLQLSATFVQTPKPNVGQVSPAESGMTVSVTLGQVGSAMSQKENKAGQLITEQNQINSRFGSTNASVGAFAADTDQPQGKTILAANGDGDQHSGSQLNPEAVAAGDTTATTGEKPPVMDIPTVPDGPKKPLINDKLSETEPKVSVDKSNINETGSKPSNTVVGKPTNSDTEVFQQGQELSQFSGGGNKEAQYTQTNLSGHVALKNSDPAQVQISGSQAKDRDNSTSDNNSDANAGRLNWMISSDNLQRLSTGQNSFSNQEAKTSSYLYPSIGEQIRESVRTSLSQGDQQITIRLNPPELGKVFIKFQEQDGEITGILEVSKQQTRYEVEQALPEVIRNLADSGIGIRRLEVVMTNTEQSQQENKDQSPASGQNGWFGQNSSADSDTQPKNYDTNETNQWLTNTCESTGFTESQHTFVTDESINMLV